MIGRRKACRIQLWIQGSPRLFVSRPGDCGLCGNPEQDDRDDDVLHSVALRDFKDETGPFIAFWPVLPDERRQAEAGKRAHACIDGGVQVNAAFPADPSKGVPN